MEEMKNAYKVLVTKSEGKWPLRRLGRRWENIKIYLTKSRTEDADWIHLAQESVTRGGLL
jgi:hypothetical protein